MTDHNNLDKLVSDAQSFQNLLDTAKTTDPMFAHALLGSLTNAGKSNIGAFIAGLIALISTRYGFGWSDETDELVGGGVMLVVGFLIHSIPLWRYRQNLPLTPPADPSAPIVIPQAATPVAQAVASEPVTAIAEPRSPEVKKTS